jgi:hypothetical protein
MSSQNDWDKNCSAREEALVFMRLALDTEFTKQLGDIESERHALNRAVDAWPKPYEADEFFEPARQNLNRKRSQLRRAYNSAWALLELLPEAPTS